MPGEATGKSILLVEDEADLVELLCYNLGKEGFDCRCATGGRAALAEIRRRPPDLIILDRMLPEESGDEVAAKLKRDPKTASIPIIMLTAKADESDQLVGFALGADDYVTKPFSLKVLLARVSVVLRRGANAAAESESISIGPITLDRSRHEVTVNGKPITLTSTEFGVLRTLMNASGRVLDREQLIDAVLGQTVAVTDRTIDVHIAAVRRKLGDAAGWVQTVRGVGYAFRPPQ